MKKIMVLALFGIMLGVLPIGAMDKKSKEAKKQYQEAIPLDSGRIIKLPFINYSLVLIPKDMPKFDRQLTPKGSRIGGSRIDSPRGSAIALRDSHKNLNQSSAPAEEKQ